MIDKRQKVLMQASEVPLLPKSAWETEVAKRLSALEKVACESNGEEDLEKMQAKIGEVLDGIVNDLSDYLARNDQRTHKTLDKQNLSGRPLSARQLSSASRDRQSAKKFYDEFARQLVIGALLNFHNPHWDPYDPSTHRPQSQSDIVRLLQLKRAD